MLLLKAESFISTGLSMDNTNSLQSFATNYTLINTDKYPREMASTISHSIQSLSTEQQMQLNDEVKLKDPTLALLLSFFFGTFAVDRFYIGNIGLGILKLIIIGGFGIWTIVDWFIIMKSTRKQNFMKLTRFLASIQ